VIEIEETFAPPPVRPHVVEELFDDPPARIKQEDDEDLPVEVANSDDGSHSLAVLVVPSFEVEAEEPSEHALMADAAARYEGFSAKPAPRSSAPQDDNAERAVKSRCITWFEREVSNHTVGDPRARGQVGWCLAEHWIDLRADRGHQEWVAIKKDEEIVLCYRPMPFDCLHLSYSGNAGEQLIVKADVYNESGYAEEGMVASSTLKASRSTIASLWLTQLVTAPTLLRSGTTRTGGSTSHLMQILFLSLTPMEWRSINLMDISSRSARLF
jgi:hypothetical protein